MLCAIISDIHSNLEALRAVLSAIDALPVDEIICLGDIVGYNADPEPCEAEALARSREVGARPSSGR